MRLSPRERQALDYESIDWEGTYKRLCVFAFSLTRSAPDVFDGVSAADLASETMLAFLTSSTRLGWRPEQRELPAFLCGVLRHKFLDHLKRHQHVAGSLDDADFSNATPAAAVDDEDGILKHIELKQRRAAWIHRLSPHKDLQDVVAAAEGVDGGRNANQQLGEALGTTPGDIANRKKRILRILFGVTK
jgi:DNA-directed RNA polymerase specialized sigma24 family protein